LMMWQILTVAIDGRVTIRLNPSDPYRPSTAGPQRSPHEERITRAARFNCTYVQAPGLSDSSNPRGGAALRGAARGVGCEPATPIRLGRGGTRWQRGGYPCRHQPVRGRREAVRARHGRLARLPRHASHPSPASPGLLWLCGLQPQRRPRAQLRAHSGAQWVGRASESSGSLALGPPGPCPPTACYLDSPD
jgi:hypothetical protein